MDPPLTPPPDPEEERGAIDVHAQRHIVDARLDLPAAGGPVTVLFGPSGAGKTTVLRVLAGLEPTDGGHVVVDGHCWDDGQGRRLPVKARRVGYLVQEHALFPHLDVLSNVRYGVRGPRASRTDHALAALRQAGAEHLIHRPVRHLSGGEAQRVALARALAPQPRLLLLDEPLSALDTPIRLQLRHDLRQLLLSRGTPTLLVTHDRAEALALADRIAVVINGRVRQLGTPDQVFDRPQDPDVAAVVGTETAVRGQVRSLDGDLALVEVGSTTVHTLRGQLGTGEHVMVCIRAEDVALTHAGRDVATSQRTALTGTVRAVTAHGPLTRVDLDVGFGLSAYVTRQALTDLHLTPGSRVTARVKAPAVHCIPLIDTPHQ